MKRTLSILLACLLLLTACGEAAPKVPNRDSSKDRDDTSASRDDDRSGADSSSDRSSDAQPGADGEDTSPGADDPLPLISFNYAVDTADNPKEFANILAFSQDGVVVWEYTTKKLDVTELERVSPIGLVGDGYLFVWDGNVICLDARTGQERWTNSDFGGAQTHSVISDGVVYLCGYYGPDLFVISADGKTIKKIDPLDNDYFWAYQLELSGDILTVTMSGGPEGDMETGHPIRVNIKDWSVES